MAFDAGEIDLGSPVTVRLHDVVPPVGFELPEGVEPDEDGARPRAHARRRRWAARSSTRRCRWTTRSSTPPVDKKRLSTIVNDLAERYTKVQVAASLDALKETGFHWATRSGTTVAISDVVTPPRKTEILEGYEAKADEGPDPVRAGSDHRRRASPGAHRDLDPGDQRGRQGDGGELPADQPDLPDGVLRCPWQLDAAASDRRYAWPGVEPEGRDHPASDQGELPRGPVGAGVLHLDPRCPQGSGRHRAADRRLRLPHPSSRRRLAGRHHPRGRLRHRPRPDHADRRRAAAAASWCRTTTSRPRSTPGPSPRTSPTPTGTVLAEAGHRPR